MSTNLKEGNVKRGNGILKNVEEGPGKHHSRWDGHCTKQAQINGLKTPRVMHIYIYIYIYEFS